MHFSTGTLTPSFQNFNRCPYDLVKKNVSSSDEQRRVKNFISPDTREFEITFIFLSILQERDRKQQPV